MPQPLTPIEERRQFEIARHRDAMAQIDLEHALAEHCPVPPARVHFVMIVVCNQCWRRSI